MPLVAMTREMGSLGMDVARILESELKVPLVYHETHQQSRRQDAPEEEPRDRLLGGKPNLFERLTADKTQPFIYTADEMLQVASKGAVMRGWGAAHLLRPVKHAIRVRICAPFELRVQRMMERSIRTTAARSPPRSATATRRRARSPSATSTSTGRIRKATTCRSTPSA